jgi:hypothetical protein
MADAWGAQRFPVQESNGEEAAGDKALTVIGEAIRAAVNADLGPLWSSVAPMSEPVIAVFTHDPKHKFNESKLPAIYIFESSSVTEVLADGIDQDERTITIYWVARMSSPKHEALRETARHIIGKVVSKLCRFGRHKSYIYPGDTESLAQTRGSFIPALAGVNSFKREQATPLELTIEAKGEEGKIEQYRGWMSQLKITELSSYDPSIGVEPNAASATLTTNGDETTTQTQDYPANV